LGIRALKAEKEFNMKAGFTSDEMRGGVSVSIVQAIGDG